jgi:hypothetical protein
MKLGLFYLFHTVSADAQTSLQEEQSRLGKFSQSRFPRTKLIIEDLQHHLCKISLHDRLHLAPLKEKNVKTALDFGTGTGIWAIEFGICSITHSKDLKLKYLS